VSARNTSTAETDENLIGGEEGIGMGMPLLNREVFPWRHLYNRTKSTSSKIYDTHSTMTVPRPLEGFDQGRSVCKPRMV